MSNRVIKETIIGSESLAAISADAERLFWRLVVLADDFGWAEGDPVVIRPRAFPRLVDHLTVQQIEAWLDELLAGERPIAEMWVLDGKPYLRLTGAASHNGSPIHFTVRATKSKHPAAAALDRATRVTTCGQLHATARRCVQPFAPASRNGNENGNENGNVEKLPGAAAAAPDTRDQPSIPLENPKTRGRKRSENPPNPDHRRLVEHYTAEFKRTQGAAPLIDKADFVAVKAVLAGRAFEEAAQLVTAFLEKPDDWSKQRGLLRLRDLPGAVTKILARQNGNRPAHDRTGAPLPEHDRDIEDTVGRDTGGIERHVRVIRSAKTGEVIERQWGRPLNQEANDEQRDQVACTH